MNTGHIPAVTDQREGLRLFSSRANHAFATAVVAFTVLLCLATGCARNSSQPKGTSPPFGIGGDVSGKYTGAKAITVSTGNCLALIGPNPSWDEFVYNADAEDAGIKANDPKYADLPPADFRAIGAETPQIRELFDEIPPGGVEEYSRSTCNYLSDLLRDNPNDPEMAKELIRLQLKQPYFGLFAGLANCMSLLSGGPGGMDGLQPDSPPAHRSARENLCP